MLKEQLVHQTLRILDRNDYVTCSYHGCFDVVGKKELLLLLKVLQNVDAFQREQAKNLRIISNNLDAHPMVIGIQTRREKLEKGVVYERFELPTISLETFESMIVHEIFPHIYRDRGGLYVEIDQDMLREYRKKKGFTQKELAELVGVNKKVIYEHEKKKLRMILEVAEKIESVLNKKIIKGIDPRTASLIREKGNPQDKLEKIVGNDLKRLGFDIDFVRQSPFDIFAKEKTLVISDVESDKRKMQRRAVSLKSFIDVTKKPAIVITEKIKEDDLLGIPILERSELKEFETGKELIKIAKRGKK